ncbi:MAG TPA: POTRA domain-containing protein [Bacteroidota bacterium]|nr:POTRA domain-containing protein [Bacteroidota bacterium]
MTAALFVLLFTVPLRGQHTILVAGIDFSGVTVFPAPMLLGALETRAGGTYQPQIVSADIGRLTALYSDSGYFAARVDSIATQFTTDSVRLRVFLTEGKQSVIDSIGFEGNVNLSEPALARNLPFGSGSPFVRSMVEAGANAILVSYENAGFPLAKVSVENIGTRETPGNIRVGFTYRVVEGERVKVKALRVEGNTTTRNSVIVREARLRGDEIYTDQLASRVRERLVRLQLFQSVSQPELFVDQHHEAGLLVKVQEGNPNRFDGVVGYVPSPRPGVSGFVTGLVDIQLRNLFGTARRLAARWYREDQNTQEIGLRYYEPWIASYPVNGEVGFFQRFQDSTFVRRTYDLHLTFQLNEQLAIGGVVSRTDVIPSDPFGMTVLAGSSSTSAGLTLSYDTRSDPLTPLAGLYYHTEYDMGTKQTDGSAYFSPGSSSIRKILMDLDYYIEPIAAQVVAAELHMQDFRSSSVELGDLFRLGGAGTLRGYREGQFLGSTIVWSNLEYRFMVERRSYLYGFLDAGYIVNPDIPLIGLHRSEQTKLGYGLGIRLDSSLGLVGVSVGFGEGDTFSTAKLHLRLINAF